MDTNIALVLGADLSKDNLSIGPGTIVRLERAVKHHRETGDTIVVAPGFAPHSRKQVESMASMMSRFLVERGCDSVIVLESETFNTIGELHAFYAYKTLGCRTIISAAYHLRRIRLLILIHFGWKKLRNTLFVVVEQQKMSRRAFMLEPLKWLYIFLPQRVQKKAVAFLQKRGINVSW